MPDRLDPTFVRAQIELLRHTHPDIWDEGDETLIADMLEAQTGLNEFLAGLLDAIDADEDHLPGLNKRIENHKTRRDRFAQRVKAMRGLALKLMTQAGVRKVVLDAATLSIKAGVPKVIITDEERLPENCFRIERKPNLTLIKELIDQGVPVSGAELSNSEETLAVRVK